MGGEREVGPDEANQSDTDVDDDENDHDHYDEFHSFGELLDGELLE